MGRVRVLFTQQPWAQSLSLGALTPPHSRTHALPQKSSRSNFGAMEEGPCSFLWANREKEAWCLRFLDKGVSLQMQEIFLFFCRVIP